MTGWLKLIGVVFVLAAVGIGVISSGLTPSPSSGEAPEEPGIPEVQGKPPAGEPATAQELRAIAAHFDTQPFTGGQSQPRVAKAASADTFVFLQFDTADGQSANRLLHAGLGVQARFCSQSQPDADAGSFSHFHRWVSPLYGLGHGTVPAADGYWMSWLAMSADSPGVGYGLFATPPDPCPDPQLDTVQPDLEPVSPEEASAIEALFDSSPFIGGQQSPYVTKWINEDVFLFLEPASSGAWPHFGIGVRGEFCAHSQPTSDFTHFQRYDASSWDDGAGGSAGDSGYWLLRYGTGAASTAIGVDRGFAPTPPPACP